MTLSCGLGLWVSEGRALAAPRFVGAAGLRRANECTTGRRRRSRAISACKAGGRVRRHLRASRRMSARPCDLQVQTGARESELRSTSGMISSIKRGQLIIRHRPGLIILFIKSNNQNEIFGNSKSAN
jgi:hypothetical protein